MKKRIQFSLVYRDMWQSSGKFQPRKDQLERIAPVIIDMGCFDRVETNGGAFEQVNLLAGEISLSMKWASRRTCWTAVSMPCVCIPCLMMFVNCSIR